MGPYFRKFFLPPLILTEFYFKMEIILYFSGELLCNKNLQNYFFKMKYIDFYINKHQQPNSLRMYRHLNYSYLM